MELKEKASVRYSRSERNAFRFLPKDGTRIDTNTLTDKIYKSTDRRPFNDRQVVLGVMNRLARKVQLNREPFRVQRSERQGPYPVNFWIEKRA